MYPFIHLDFINFKIPLYGLMLSISLLCGYWFARRELVGKYGYDEKMIDRIISFLILGSLLGARIFSLVFEMDLTFVEFIDKLFSIQVSGVTFYGGLIVGIIVTVVFIVINHWEFVVLADVIAVPIIFGLGLTRIGCFLAGFCWGTPTDLPWGSGFYQSRINLSIP